MSKYTDLKQYLAKEVQKLKFLKDGVDLVDQLEGAETALSEINDQITQANKDKDAAVTEANDVKTQLNEAMDAVTKANEKAGEIVDAAKQDAADIIKKANEDAEQLITDTTEQLAEAKAEMAKATADKDQILMDIEGLTKVRDGLNSDMARLRKKLD